jgi:hypothetical protein
MQVASWPLCFKKKKKVLSAAGAVTDIKTGGFTVERLGQAALAGHDDLMLRLRKGCPVFECLCKITKPVRHSKGGE